jgi:hypothetical protein
MATSTLDAENLDAGAVDDSKLERFEPPVPRRLYDLAEQQQWAVRPLDFSRDRLDWSSLPNDERTMLLKSIAPFYAGEERVAAVLAPIILAAEEEQELAFLASQQADEARHMQFFERVWREVLSTAGDGGGAALADARARCNNAFAELFDRRLIRSPACVRIRPTSMRKSRRWRSTTLSSRGRWALPACTSCSTTFSADRSFPASPKGCATSSATSIVMWRGAPGF